MGVPLKNYVLLQNLLTAQVHHCPLGLKKKVLDWRNPTDPIYPADPTYFY